MRSRHGLIHEVVRLAQLEDQAHLFGAFGADPLAAHQHPACILTAEEAGKGHAARELGSDPERSERAFETGVRRGEDEVGEAEDRRSETEAETVDCEDQRLREVDQGAAQAGEAVLLLGTVTGGELGHLDQVLAGREGVFAAGEDDDSDAGVVGGGEECLGGAVPHLGVHRVLGLRPLERDGANSTIVHNVNHQNRPPSIGKCWAVPAASLLPGFATGPYTPRRTTVGGDEDRIVASARQARSWAP